MKDSTKPEIIANQSILIEIIKAEAFVPLHLKIEAVELVPNESGKWVDGEKLYFDKIENEVNQSKAEAYNLDGKKAEKQENVEYKDISLDVLKLWFDVTNAAAIFKAFRTNGDAIDNVDDLHAEVIALLPKEKRSLQKTALNNRIKFT